MQTAESKEIVASVSKPSTALALEHESPPADAQDDLPKQPEPIQDSVVTEKSKEADENSPSAPSENLFVQDDSETATTSEEPVSEEPQNPEDAPSELPSEEQVTADDPDSAVAVEEPIFKKVSKEQEPVQDSDVAESSEEASESDPPPPSEETVAPEDSSDAIASEEPVLEAPETTEETSPEQQSEELAAGGDAVELPKDAEEAVPKLSEALETPADDVAVSRHASVHPYFVGTEANLKQGDIAEQEAPTQDETPAEAAEEINEEPEAPATTDIVEESPIVDSPITEEPAISEPLPDSQEISAVVDTIPVEETPDSKTKGAEVSNASDEVVAIPPVEDQALDNNEISTASSDSGEVDSSKEAPAESGPSAEPEPASNNSVVAENESEKALPDEPSSRPEPSPTETNDDVDAQRSEAGQVAVEVNKDVELRSSEIAEIESASDDKIISRPPSSEDTPVSQENQPKSEHVESPVDKPQDGNPDSEESPAIAENIEEGVTSSEDSQEHLENAADDAQTPPESTDKTAIVTKPGGDATDDNDAPHEPALKEEPIVESDLISEEMQEDSKPDISSASPTENSPVTEEVKDQPQIEEAEEVRFLLSHLLD